MKNRVYKIKDKILVRGNENELTENEVLVKEEKGSVILKERVSGEVKDIVIKGAEKSITDLGFVGTFEAQPKNKSAFPCTFSEDQIAIIKNTNLPFSIDVLIDTTNIKLIFEHKSNTESVFVSFSGYTEINRMIAPFFATTTSDKTVLDIIGLL